MRLPNWDVLLVAFAEEWRGQEFAWGKTDCGIMVRAGLRSMLGKDPWGRKVGKWTSKRGALLRSGQISYEDALCATGAVEVGSGFATAGDVAMGADRDPHGMVALSLLVPTRKALISTVETGVALVDKLQLDDGVRFWRYV